MKAYLYVLSLSLASGCLPVAEAPSSNSNNDTLRSGKFENGFYGFSPTSVFVVWSKPEPWSAYQVFHNLGGINNSLDTLVSENRIINLSPNSIYSLSLYGQDRSFLRSPEPLLNTDITTWEPFSTAGSFIISHKKQASGGNVRIFARISVNYSAFKVLPPGPGVAEKTFAECFISNADVEPRNNPFVDSQAVVKRFLLSDGSIDINNSEINFFKQKNVGCQLVYADGTTSRIAEFQTTKSNFNGTLASCPKTITQGQLYTCDASVLDETGAKYPNAGLEIDLTQSTCPWKALATLSGDESSHTRRISAMIDKNAYVTTCDLVYRSKVISHPTLVNRITVTNRAPTLSFKEPGGSSVPLIKNTIVIPENTKYPVTPKVFGISTANFDLTSKAVTFDANQMESNEISDGITFRNISQAALPIGLLPDLACDRHLKTPLVINPSTGKMTFTFNDHFFGQCRFKIEVDDGTGAVNAKVNAELNVTVYPINDPPSFRAQMPKAALSTEVNTERCAKINSITTPTMKEHFLGCLVGVEESINIPMLMGGSAPTTPPLPSKYYDEVNSSIVSGQTANIVTSTFTATAKTLYTPPAHRTVALTKNSGAPLNLSSPILTTQNRPGAIPDPVTGAIPLVDRADFLVATTGSSIKFTPQNPDVTEVVLNFEIEDSGYLESEINSLARVPSEQIYTSSTRDLFLPKKSSHTYTIQVGEYMSRFTDFHVIHDTSSTGKAMIDYNIGVVDKWYDKTLRAKYSPKHQGSKFHRRLGDERWLGGFLAASLKVAYGNLSVTNAAGATVTLPANHESLDSYFTSPGNSGDPNFPRLYEEIRAADLPPDMDKKEIMMLSFCDESQSISWLTNQNSAQPNKVSIAAVNSNPNAFDPFPAHDDRWFAPGSVPARTDYDQKYHTILNYHGAAFSTKRSNSIVGGLAYGHQQVFLQNGASDPSHLNTSHLSTTELANIKLFDLQSDVGLRFFEPVSRTWQFADTGWRPTNGSEQQSMMNFMWFDHNPNASGAKFSVITKSQMDYFKHDYELFEKIVGDTGNRIRKNNFKGIAYPIVTKRYLHPSGSPLIGASLDYLIHAMAAVMGRDYIDPAVLHDYNEVEDRVSAFMGPRNDAFSEDEWHWLKTQLIDFARSPVSHGTYDRGLYKNYNWVGKWNKTTDKPLTEDDFTEDMLTLKNQ
jgi:hypothetical protein